MSVKKCNFGINNLTSINDLPTNFSDFLSPNSIWGGGVKLGQAAQNLVNSALVRTIITLL